MLMPVCLFRTVKCQLYLGIWILEAPPPQGGCNVHTDPKSFYQMEKERGLERRRCCWKEESLGKDTDMCLGRK